MRGALPFSPIVLGAVSIWSVALAGEVSVKRSALPAAVNAALESRYPGAQFLGFTRETTKGVTVFEAEMKTAGRRVDASFESDGKLHEEEAEIAVAEIPAKVSASLATSAQANWKIEHAERITTADATAAERYELLVVNHKQRLELMYAADGKRLSATAASEKD